MDSFLIETFSITEIKLFQGVPLILERFYCYYMDPTDCKGITFITNINDFSMDLYYARAIPTLLIVIDDGFIDTGIRLSKIAIRPGSMGGL